MMKKPSSEPSVFKIGSLVRLRVGRNTARISGFYTDVKGGCYLDRKLEGFFSWNVADLVLVEGE